jgi:PAS domain S-box-containing protein
MKFLSANKFIIAALLLCISASMFVFIISIKQTKKVKQTSEEVVHTNKVLSSLDKIITATLDIQNGSRGFVITGDEQFLEPVITAEQNYGNALTTINDMQKHSHVYNVAQLDSLRSLISKRIEVAHKMTALRRQNKVAEAVEIVASGAGNKLTQQIRGICNSIKQAELNTQNEIRTKNEKAILSLNTILYTTLIIVVLLGVLLFVKVKTAFNEHKAGEEKFKALLESAPDAMLITDNNGVIELVNREAEKMLGYSRKELTGMQVEALIPHEQREKHSHLRMNYGNAPRVRNMDGGIEMQAVKKDGAAIPVEISLSPITTNGQVFVAAALRDISQRKAAQQEIQNLFTQINQASEAIYVINHELQIQSWNKGAENLYGYTKEEAIGKNSVDLLQTVLTKEELDAALNQMTNTGFWSSEIKRKNKLGKEIYVYSSLSAVKGNNGHGHSYVSVSFDISERKKLEEEVNYLASIVEQSTEAVISVSYERKIISWNIGAERLHGFTAAEAIGKPILELGIGNYSDEDITAIYNNLQQNGIWVKEDRLYHKDGTSFWAIVTGNLLKNKKGEFQSVVLFEKDISLQKKLEDELKQHNEILEQRVEERTKEIALSEEKYRLLFENNPMPMWVYDIHTFKILGINKAAEILYGYTREEFLSMTLLDVRSDEEKKRFLKVDHSFERKEIGLNRGIWPHQKKDGTEIQIEIFNHPLLFEGKKARLTMLSNVTERVKAEADLVASEKRFRALIENSYDIITMLDKDFNVLYRSPSAIRVTGRNDDEVLGLDGTKRIHPDDKAAIGAGIKRLLAAPGNVEECIFRYQHSDGSYLWLEGNATNLLHDEAVKAIVFNYRDVTERIAAQEKVIASEKRFRALIENSYDIITMLDKDFNVVYRSPSAIRVTGREDDEVLGFDGTKKIHPEDMAFVAAGIKRLLAAPGNVEECIFRYQHKDGSYLWMEGNATNLLHDEAVKAIVFNYRDVSDRIAAQNKISSSEKRFRALIENGSDILNLMDASFNITYRSPSAKRISNLDDSDVIGHDGRNRIHPDDREMINAGIKRLLAAPGNSEKCIFRFQHTDGHYMWLDGTATNLLHDEAVKSIVFNYREVSERIEAEEKLRESEERFRSAMDNMMEGVQIIGFDWKYKYVNNALVKQSKCSREELLGYGILEKYPCLKDSKLYQRIQTCMTERLPAQLETKLAYPDKTVAWFELSIQPVPEGIFILSVDITERVKAAAALKEERDKLTSISATSPGLIYSFRMKPDGTFSFPYASNAIEEILGVSYEDVMDDATLLFNSPNQVDKELLLTSIQASVLNMTPWQLAFRYLHPVKGMIWLEGNSLPAMEADGSVIWHGILMDITERVHAADILQEERDKLMKIAATSPGLIYSFRMTPDGKFSCPFTSNAVEDIFGITHETARENIAIIIGRADEEDREALVNSILESAKEMKPWQIIFRYHHPTKGKIWLQGNSLPVKEADGSTLWHGIILDITAEKKIEEKIVEKSAQLETLSNNLPGVMIYQLSGEDFANRKFTYVSKEVTRLTGKTPEEVIANPGLLYGLIHEDDIPKLVKAEKESFERMDIFNEEVRCFTHDGKMKWLNIVSTPRKTIDGKLVWDGFHVDITDRKKNEAALRNSYIEKRMLAEKLTTILNTLPANIALLDENGIIVDVNQSWMEFAATNHLYGSNYGIGENYIRLTESSFSYPNTDKQKVAEGVNAVLHRRTEKFVYEYLCHTINRGQWFRKIVSPLLGEGYTGAVVMHIDITELRRLEEERLHHKTEEQKIITHAILQGQEKERNAIGKELHDNINQILAGIHMLLGLLTKRPEKLQELLPLCIENVNLAIRENRNLAHELATPDEESENLVEQVKRVTKNMLQNAGMTARVSYKSFDETLLTKEQKLAAYRIVQEQCTNIVKYAKAKKVVVLLQTSNGKFLLILKDNGCGMENGKRTDGIGLQNIKSRVQVLNGTVNITTKPGAGFMLSVEIPLISTD